MTRVSIYNVLEFFYVKLTVKHNILDLQLQWINAVTCHSKGIQEKCPSI